MTDKELPAPLVPAYVDLTNFDDMPLNVRKLRESRMVAKVPSEAAMVNVILWCASWHQVPAGSLPDDDIDLCDLAGFGRMVAHWKEVRSAGALYGFERCSDGRLYHRVVCQVALVAWRRKRLFEYEKACDRLRKANHKLGQNHPEIKPIPEFEAWDSVEMAKVSGAFAPSSAGKAAYSDGKAALESGIPPPSKPVPRNSTGKIDEGSGIPPENALKGKERNGEERKGEEQPTARAHAPGLPAATPPGAGSNPAKPEVEENAAATLCGEACKLMKAEGFTKVNPSHPDLIALITAGVPPVDFGHTARELKLQGDGKPMTYILKTIARRIAEVAKPGPFQPKAGKADVDHDALARTVLGDAYEAE